jgi:predicted RNase H-like HicB family nuclease
MCVSRQTDESVFKSHFTQANDGWWVARDEETGVASQSETRQNALDNLNEAVALHKGEIGKSIDSWEEEEKVLEELGIDPDGVAQNRDEHDGLPEFMQVELPNGEVVTSSHD